MSLRYLALLCCLVLCACGSVQVVYDYDKKTDFSQFKSYDYYPNMESGLSELDNKRLFKHLDSLLQTNGYEYSTTPDIYINIKTSSRPKPSNSSVGIGIGGTGRNIGGGVSVGVPLGGKEQYREIVFDIINATEDELVWQAVSEGIISEQMTPEVRNAKLKEVVDKVFTNFPPK